MTNYLDPDDRPSEYCIVLVEGASLISIGCLCEPFEFLKTQSEGSKIVVSTIHLKRQNSDTRAGVTLSGNDDVVALLERVSTLNRPSAIFLCCGLDVPVELRDDLRRLIRACKRNGVRIASIGAATWVMAEERAIPAAECVVHWASEAAFAERNLSLQVTNNLYNAVGKVATCAGELATLDFMIDFLASEFGNQTAKLFCNHTLVSFPRQSTSVQPGASENRLRHLPDMLRSAVRLMSQNIDAPLSLGDIARTHNISQRQLERVFSKHLGCSPRKYYRDLRLDVAYQLCEQTELDLIEVALASGFSSNSLFSRHFRAKFGITPSTLRRGTSMTGKPKNQS